MLYRQWERSEIEEVIEWLVEIQEDSTGDRCNRRKAELFSHQGGDSYANGETE